MCHSHLCLCHYRAVLPLRWLCPNVPLLKGHRSLAKGPPESAWPFLHWITSADALFQSDRMHRSQVDVRVWGYSSLQDMGLCEFISVPCLERLWAPAQGTYHRSVCHHRCHRKKCKPHSCLSYCLGEEGSVTCSVNPGSSVRLTGPGAGRSPAPPQPSSGLQPPRPPSPTLPLGLQLHHSAGEGAGKP